MVANRTIFMLTPRPHDKLSWQTCLQTWGLQTKFVRPHVQTFAQTWLLKCLWLVCARSTNSKSSLFTNFERSSDVTTNIRQTWLQTNLCVHTYKLFINWGWQTFVENLWKIDENWSEIESNRTKFCHKQSTNIVCKLICASTRTNFSETEVDKRLWTVPRKFNEVTNLYFELC